MSVSVLPDCGEMLSKVTTFIGESPVDSISAEKLPSTSTDTFDPFDKSRHRALHPPRRSATFRLDSTRPASANPGLFASPRHDRARHPRGFDPRREHTRRLRHIADLPGRPEGLPEQLEETLALRVLSAGRDRSTKPSRRTTSRRVSGPHSVGNIASPGSTFGASLSAKAKSASSASTDLRTRRSMPSIFAK
jgi:hypothetical protein